jgi:hypothetical protein
LRERDDEIERLRIQVTDTEKKQGQIQYGEVDSQRTINSLRSENQQLSKTIEQLRSSGRQAGGAREREL